jgi:peptide/nickel transport system permease protein
MWSEAGMQEYPLGTDQLGRDLASRMIYGARASLTIASIAAGVGAIFGALIGLVSGYFRGRTETVLMRLVDVQLAFPFILLALSILSVVESRGLLTLSLVLTLAGWVIHARVTRGRVLVEREKDYVLAAKALGASHARIMFAYILPVILPTIFVIMLIEVAVLMVAESVLAFIGLGINPPGISWGTIIADGRGAVAIAPWMTVLPGLAIFLSVLGMNLLADGLADVLDPKLRGSTKAQRVTPSRRGTNGRGGVRDGRRDTIVTESHSSRRLVGESPRSKLLSVQGLRVEFPQEQRSVVAVENVSFDVEAGQRLGIVGESGSGKSVTGMSIMGLLDPPGRVTAGSILFQGRELLDLSPREMNNIRGSRIAMIFQDPSSSLNPTLTVSYQMTEVIRRHQAKSRKEAKNLALELLESVNINDPERVAASYPFQLSGGMQQRVMIATALSCNPDLLIADEPTTALDVTTQAQIMSEIDSLVRKSDTGIILITHDLGLVSEFTDDVVVMQEGLVRESGRTRSVIENPQHPYTQGLLDAVLELEETKTPMRGE